MAVAKAPFANAHAHNDCCTYLAVCTSNSSPHLEQADDVQHGCEEEEEFYKLLPANKADHLCQLWQSCSDLHKIQTVYDIVENPHPIRLSKK